MTLLKSWRPVFLSTLVCGTLHAQVPPLSHASSLIQEGRPAEALAILDSLILANPENGEAHFWQGVGLYGITQYEESLRAFTRSRLLNAYPAFSWYYTARAAARLERAAETFDALDSALSNGFRDINRFRTEEAFAIYRGSKALTRIEAELDKAAKPCEYDPRYRQLDFWLGTWDVYSPAGTKLGTNRIEKALDGALIIENWSSPMSQGMSLNYFDPSIGKFRQHWVDSRGGNVWYIGEVVDGVMHYEGKWIRPDGSSFLNRVAIEPLKDGTVRHTIEQSTDGREWRPFFEAIYRKTGN